MYLCILDTLYSFYISRILPVLHFSRNMMCFGSNIYVECRSKLEVLNEIVVLMLNQKKLMKFVLNDAKGTCQVTPLILTDQVGF